jgi:hypothetical protein
VVLDGVVQSSRADEIMDELRMWIQVHRSRLELRVNRSDWMERLPVNKMDSSTNLGSVHKYLAVQLNVSGRCQFVAPYLEAV